MKDDHDWMESFHEGKPTKLPTPEPEETRTDDLSWIADAVGDATDKDDPLTEQEAKRAAARREMLDVRQWQDDRRPGFLVKRSVQGAALVGGGWIVWRILRAVIEALTTKTGGRK